jgi:hypothetical protein
MFTYTGRSLYILFAATVAIAIAESSGTENIKALFLSVGSFTALNALLNFIIVCTHPNFGDLAAAAKASVEEEAAAWLIAHPAVVARALRGDSSNPWSADDAASFESALTAAANPYADDTERAAGAAAGAVLAAAAANGDAVAAAALAAAAKGGGGGGGGGGAAAAAAASLNPFGPASGVVLNPFGAAIEANARAAGRRDGRVSGAVREWNARASFSAGSQGGSSRNAFGDEVVL